MCSIIKGVEEVLVCMKRKLRKRERKKISKKFPSRLQLTLRQYLLQCFISTHIPPHTFRCLYLLLGFHRSDEMMAMMKSQSTHVYHRQQRWEALHKHKHQENYIAASTKMKKNCLSYLRWKFSVDERDEKIDNKYLSTLCIHGLLLLLWWKWVEQSHFFILAFVGI